MYAEAVGIVDGSTGEVAASEGRNVSSTSGGAAELVYYIIVEVVSSYAAYSYITDAYAAASGAAVMYSEVYGVEEAVNAGEADAAG